MRIAALALVFLPVLSLTAFADETTPKVQHLESWNDIAFDIGRGAIQHRFLMRVVINELDKDNGGEFAYGLGYKPDPHLRFYLTGGYGLSGTQGNVTQSAIVSTWADAAYGPHGAYHARYEGEHRYGFGGAGYRYDGYYAVDYWIVGAHFHNRGAGTEAGFQIGSGPGLLPYRFDIRISFGIDGMPKRTSAFVMSFDVP